METGSGLLYGVFVVRPWVLVGTEGLEDPDDKAMGVESAAPAFGVSGGVKQV